MLKNSFSSSGQNQINISRKMLFFGKNFVAVYLCKKVQEYIWGRAQNRTAQTNNICSYRTGMTLNSDLRYPKKSNTAISP